MLEWLALLRGHAAVAGRRRGADGVAPRPSASLACADSEPKLMPAMVIGIFSWIGFGASRAPSVDVGRRISRDSLRADSATSTRRETADRRSAAACAWRRRRGCHRCRCRGTANLGQRMIVEGRRHRAAACGIRRSGGLHQYASDVVDVEMIELARRAVAAELAGIDLPSSPARVQQLARARRLLSLCIGFSTQSAPRLFTSAADKEPRLVDRIAERFAGVAKHHQIAGLRHEGRHMADRSLDDDIDALHRNAAARAERCRRSPASPPRPVAPAAWLASPFTWTSPDIMFSAMPGPALPLTINASPLVHAGAIVAGMTFDLDLIGARCQRQPHAVRAD